MICTVAKGHLSTILDCYATILTFKFLKSTIIPHKEPTQVYNKVFMSILQDWQHCIMQVWGKFHISREYPTNINQIVILKAINFYTRWTFSPACVYKGPFWMNGDVASTWAWSKEQGKRERGARIVVRNREIDKFH
jgi:hypothetical protein